MNNSTTNCYQTEMHTNNNTIHKVETAATTTTTATKTPKRSGYFGNEKEEIGKKQHQPNIHEKYHSQWNINCARARAQFLKILFSKKCGVECWAWDGTTGIKEENMWKIDYVEPTKMKVIKISTTLSSHSSSILTSAIFVYYCYSKWWSASYLISATAIFSNAISFPFQHFDISTFKNIKFIA